jgi:hypothetical protein
MASAEKLITQLNVVIDLSVADDPDRMVFIGKRLCASLKINDSESVVSQQAVSREAIQTKAPIGPAVAQ